MDTRRVALLGVGLLAAFLLAAVATADPVQVAERPPTLGWEPPDVQPPVDEPEGFVPNEPDPIAPAESISVADATETLTMVLEILAFLAVVAAAIYLARAHPERRDEGRGRGRDGLGSVATLAEVADAISGDAELHRAALRAGAARNAIVECWVRLEASVHAAGVEPDPALTSTELTAEVLRRFPVDADAVERLGALYREARFSIHDLDEAHRSAAVVALDAVHDGLRRASSSARSVRTGAAP